MTSQPTSPDYAPRPPHEVAPQLASHAGHLTVVPEILVLPPVERLGVAAEEFVTGINALTLHDVEPADRATKVSFNSVDRTAYTKADWSPRSVYAYSSQDPWQKANPEATAVVTRWIDTNVAVFADDAVRADPMLAYLDARRSNGGRRMTEPTRLIAETDPGINTWVRGLPEAPMLRPVAHPWSDIPTKLFNKQTGQIDAIYSSKHLLALVGGAADGRAVREREAWVKAVLPELLPSELTDNELTITSLGTGTGEPAMDTGLDVVAAKKVSGQAGQVIVNGIDVKPESLAVASHLAGEKATACTDGTDLEFRGSFANLLSADGLATVVANTKANVYEAIGFAEYVPSDHSQDPQEQQMRTLMEARGLLSAEDFYATIYKNMPDGAVLVTGNMRNDSPQASFVINGLGWQGIIQRDTETYLDILRNANIPGEAVSLYVPDSEDSAGVYNLVTIQKLPTKQA